MNTQANLTDDVMKAVSVLSKGGPSKDKESKDGEVNLLSIVEKLSRNRKKGGGAKK